MPARPPWAGPRARAVPHEVRVERGARVAADRDDPLLAALTSQPNGAGGVTIGPAQLKVVDVEAHGLGDPCPGAIQQFEQRAVAQAGGFGGTGRGHGAEQAFDVGDGDRLGQPPGRRGRAHLPRRVGSGEALAERERVQATHGDHGAGGGARGQRWMPVAAGRSPARNAATSSSATAARLVLPLAAIASV